MKLHLIHEPNKNEMTGGFYGTISNERLIPCLLIYRKLNNIFFIDSAVATGNRHIILTKL